MSHRSMGTFNFRIACARFVVGVAVCVCICGQVRVPKCRRADERLLRMQCMCSSPSSSSSSSAVVAVSRRRVASIKIKRSVWSANEWQSARARAMNRSVNCAVNSRGETTLNRMNIPSSMLGVPSQSPATHFEFVEYSDRQHKTAEHNETRRRRTSPSHAAAITFHYATG